MVFTFGSFIYRVVRSTLIKLMFSTVVIITNYPSFASFNYEVAMFIAYIICFVVKLALILFVLDCNFILCKQPFLRVITNITDEWRDKCRRMRNECRRVKTSEDE